MNQEPIALYIFRFVMGLGLFAFMAMLYWSSVLVEQDLRFVKENLLQIKNELEDVKRKFEKVTSQVFKGVSEYPTQKAESILHPFSSSKNLLTKDLFYEHTLVHLLGPNFKPHGIRKEDTVGKPDNLHPFSNWIQVSTWNALCTLALTKEAVGKYETFTPDMALSMELRYTSEGRPEYWIFLRQDVFWEPLDPLHFPEDVKLAPDFLHKHQVTAHDFKFYFDAVMNPHVEESQAVALRLYYNGIEDMRVVDDFTLVARWKAIPIQGEDGKEAFQMKYLAKSFTGALRPLPRFVYQYFSDGTKIVADDADPNTYRTNPIWALNFSHHWTNNVIVSCGPWLFDGMTDREIRFRRSPDYFDPYAALINSDDIQFRNSPDAIWEDFKIGALDLFAIPPNLLAEFDQFLQSEPYQHQQKNGLGIKRLDYLARSYDYIGWNQARPLFKSRKIRQALTLAIDRERIIRQNLNDMGVQTTGTFFLYSPSYDPSLTPYPFDPDLARQLLQQEGWYDSTGEGVISKIIDGKRIPFRFTLTYFVKNPITKAICEYISTALKEVGIDCNPNGVDIADLSAVFENKDFDAVCLGWALGSPPEDPKQVWYSTGAKERGSSNAIGFANAEVDRIIDQLEYEYDQKKRIELYHQFDKIIYEEAPYTFLYIPKIALAYREYMQNIFIPAKRQDLIQGANVGEPIPSLFWIKNSPYAK